MDRVGVEPTTSASLRLSQEDLLIFRNVSYRRRTFLFKSHPLHSEIRVLVGGVWYRAQGLASKIKLNGVCVARRNFEKPADVTTCFILSSPACAPSAGPFSFKDAGTQIIVDPE
jgi:hypothetical protein